MFKYGYYHIELYFATTTSKKNSNTIKIDSTDSNVYHLITLNHTINTAQAK